MDNTPTPAATPAPATTPADPARLVNETDPDFEFLGLRRKHWRELYKAAYKADKAAADAEAEADAAEVRLREGRDRLERIAATEFDASENAKVAAARATVAREMIDRATSRKEREERKVAAAEAEEKASAADAHAKGIKKEIEGGRANVVALENALKTYRETAARLRAAAEVAGQRAKTIELPIVREQLELAEAIGRKRREIEALRAARRHLVRVTCRDCRHWEPSAHDPALGVCCARPPAATMQGGVARPMVASSDWCALGETIPAVEDKADTAEGEADAAEGNAPDAP